MKHRNRRSSTLAVLLAGTMLSGCSSLGISAADFNPLNWFGGAKSTTAYPNLLSTPSQAPASPTAANRVAIQQALIADQQNAQHGVTKAAEAKPPAAAAQPPAVAVLAKPPAAPAPDAPPAPAAAATPPNQVAQAGGGLSTPPPAKPRAAPRPRKARAQPGADAGNLVGKQLAVIVFDNGSATISASSDAVLRQLTAMAKSRGLVLRVVGHASSRTRQMGRDAHRAANEEMARRRAEAVVQALLGRGLDASQVVALSAADDDPIYVESIPFGEAGNRRVEIYLENIVALASGV